MCRDLHAQGRQVVDVPTLCDLPHHPRSLALRDVTSAWPMQDHLIGKHHVHQRVPVMTCVSSGSLAARVASLCFAREAVTGRRRAPGLALFGQPLFHPPERAHQSPFAFLDAPMFLRHFFSACSVRFSPLSRFFFRHARRLSALSRLFQRT